MKYALEWYHVDLTKIKYSFRFLLLIASSFNGQIFATYWFNFFDEKSVHIILDLNLHKVEEAKIGPKTNKKQISNFGTRVAARVRVKPPPPPVPGIEDANNENLNKVAT